MKVTLIFEKVATLDKMKAILDLLCKEPLLMEVRFERVSKNPAK